MASVTAGGIGIGSTGLLWELHGALMNLPASPFGFETARAVLTGFVVAALSVALWALMMVVVAGENERRERFVAMAVGFGFVLVVVSVLQIVSALAGSGAASAMLFAIQAATLLSMLAAGGLEFAWEDRASASAAESETEALSERIGNQLAASRAGLAVLKAMAREKETV
ncbi:hypothetical protein [Oricola thermophila]|uniref:Uncharacterized protein n=1 Tax=Oricola thermophila TaxID=2742145 RepID=A0A6N1VAG5_9HYPH|nr:hypothetical protein [Oricola thermophila]QKV17991.1 hypothetical protein HTY61_05705 [Oricola thermophila]